MDHAAYHVVYVDTRMSSDLDGKHIKKVARVPEETPRKDHDEPWEEHNPECVKAIIAEIEEVRSNLKHLLSEFDGGTFQYFSSSSLTILCAIRYISRQHTSDVN